MKWPFSFPRTTKSRAIVCTIAASLVLWEYVKLEPRSWLGQQKFRIGYRLTSNTDAYLQQYWEDIIENDGGWLSPGSDSFLWTRLSQDTSQKEFDAVSTFYLSMGTNNRGRRIHSDEQIKLKIIDRLLGRISTMPPAMKIETIKWIEEIRSEEFFHKGGLYCDNWNQAVALYKQWWNSDLPWSKKKLIYPLEGTSATINWGP